MRQKVIDKLERKTKPAKTRPLINIDWKKVDELLIAGCLGTEIASYIGIHPDSFYRRCEEEKAMCFTEYKRQKSAIGESILRATQFDEAVRGRNTTMLVWLGKQRLNQNDKQSVEHSGQVPIQIVKYSDKPIEPWKKEKDSL